MILIPIIFGVIILAIIIAGIWSIKTETRTDKYPHENLSSVS